jgi:iron-sulfur cluster repair protein YtfE (RIC family)
MKATDFLKRQHRELEKTFKEALKSERPRERRQMLQEIQAQIQLHSMLEEQIFYPAYREAAATKKAAELVAEALEEHHVVDLVLADLAKVEPSAENYEAKITVLMELIEHHVEEEEAEMFPSAEKKLGKQRLEELAEELAERAEAGE